MEKRHDLGVTPRDDVAREGVEGGRPRAPGVHDGGDAGVDPGKIGIDPGPVDALEDVGVAVDQPRGDDLAPDLDHPRGLAYRDARGDARDLPILDRHVEDTVKPARRVNDGATLQQKIVHVCPLGKCLLPTSRSGGHVGSQNLTPDPTSNEAGAGTSAGLVRERQDP